MPSPALSPAPPPILELRDVRTHFPISSGFLFKRHVGTVKAVDGVTLSVARGEVLGLVGESGCGKSTLARTILQLVPTTGGTVVLSGQNLTTSNTADILTARRDLQMVFQDPYASLNPRMTVFDTLAEPLLVHGVCSPADINTRVATLMRTVGLAPRFMQKYPHEFSGGQRQRIAIARALAPGSDLIICDEAVSALDVSVKAQIVNLLSDLQDELGLTLLFISHDLAIVEHLTHRVAVMYLGKIVELADRKTLFGTPHHPYTRALLSAVPVPDPTVKRQRIILHGDVPSPINPPSGCRFHTRCPFVFDRCKIDEPQLRDVGLGRMSACHLDVVPDTVPVANTKAAA